MRAAFITIILLFVNLQLGAKTVEIFYQSPRFLSHINFLTSQPTLEQMITLIGVSKFDSSLYKELVAQAKKNGIDLKSRLPEINFSGNKLTVSGLPKPLVFSNTQKVEVSYEGEVIPLTNSQDFLTTVQDLKTFFEARQKSSKNMNRPSRWNQNARLWIEPAYAAIPYIIYIGVSFAVAVPTAVYWAKEKFGLKKDLSFKYQWPFHPENWSKEIKISCSDEQIKISQGDETIFYKYNEVAVTQVPGDIFSAVEISYSSPRRTPPIGTLEFRLDKSQVSKKSGFFVSDHFKSKPEREGALIESAMNALGADGKKNLCYGNKKNRSVKELVDLEKLFNILRKDDDKAIVPLMRSMEAGSNRQTQ